MQKTKREVLNKTLALIEQIRTEINTGRCNGCMTCNKVSELHDLLVQLLVLIKDDYPIECERLQKRTNVNGNQKCSDFGNSECSIFGIKTTVLLASAVQ